MSSADDVQDGLAGLGSSSPSPIFKTESMVKEDLIHDELNHCG